MAEVFSHCSVHTDMADRHYVVDFIWHRFVKGALQEAFPIRTLAVNVLPASCTAETELIWGHSYNWAIAIVQLLYRLCVPTTYPLAHDPYLE
jgi:hypothetical protein